MCFCFSETFHIFDNFRATKFDLPDNNFIRILVFQLAITFFWGTLRIATCNNKWFPKCARRRMWSLKSWEPVCQKDYALNFQNLTTNENGFQKFQIFSILTSFVFTGAWNEVAGPPQQRLECLKGSHLEWRRSHSSAGQWERRTLSKQRGQNWNLHSVPVTRWPIASSSCKPLAARLINNTPRVVALSRNEAWRSGGSATTRGVLFISRVSVF